MVVGVNFMVRWEGREQGGAPAVSGHLELYTKERVMIEYAQAIKDASGIMGVGTEVAHHGASQHSSRVLP